MIRKFLVALFSGLPLVPAAHATVVQFQTVLGNFEVNLYDQTTPATVANFLNYVDNGAYTNSFIHRSAANFVIQGGGFVHEDNASRGIASAGPVVNEPVHSTVTGTIAMAALGGDPDSATSQWFFNLGDNSANLDVQNGGFTVFGEVLADGMTVVNTLAQFSRFDFGPPFSSLPLRNYSSGDYNGGVSPKEPTDENLLMVLSVVVIDAAADTAANLNPAPNTLLDEAAAGSGSGTLTWVLLALGATLGLRRSRRRPN